MLMGRNLVALLDHVKRLLNPLKSLCNNSILINNFQIVKSSFSINTVASFLIDHTNKSQQRFCTMAFTIVHYSQQENEFKTNEKAGSNY